MQLMSVNRNMLKINKSFSANKWSLITDNKTGSTMSTMHTRTMVSPTMHLIGDLAALLVLIDDLSVSTSPFPFDLLR